MSENKTHYILAIGRRKTATARVRITPDTKTSVTVNGKSGEEYFNTATRRSIPLDPLNLDEIDGTFKIEARVSGGGNTAQAEAIRMGVARALTKDKETLRTPLKKAGFLKRDPRAVERKKPGLLKARKAPAWSKR